MTKKELESLVAEQAMTIKRLTETNAQLTAELSKMRMMQKEPKSIDVGHRNPTIPYWDWTLCAV